ncbi:hybrid sensor histidine kinase/response regulator [Belnapia moabensis]|uniref:hybrid sensor histidine kinase/response regulator n=1 Tax=Belnapia moabensis TaxID=365533 RepID=UPI0006940412|nr:PAS domain-containing sensor histidine kinase [Belnapia moabensis]
MSDLARWLLDPFGLTPHGFCLLWEPWLIWTHALSDVSIGLAYFSIPLALISFARRRRDLVFKPVLWLFAAFILLCGAGHWLDLLTLWVPAYGLEGLVKALTAAVSLVAAIVLWPLMPRALALPSPSLMQASNKALRESEARHRANFVGAPVPLHILDVEGRIVEVSDRWLDLLGYSRMQVIGRSVGDFQEDGGASTRAALPAVFAAAAELRDTPRRFIRRDGAVLDVLASSRLERAPDGVPTHLITALVDVTARKRAETALAESERSFRLLVDGVADYAIYMLSLNGIVTTWNPGAERIKGYSASEIIGQHLRRFYTEEDRATGAAERALGIAAEEGRYESEGWRLRKDGSRFWASVVIDAIRENGTLVGFAKVTRDITQQRAAAEALEITRTQLAQAQKMEAIGQLTGGIAHDFNNMLQAMTGNLELIRRRVGEERPDVARLAGNALDAGAKAAGLTSQLLSFARRQRLDPRPLDPAEVITGMRNLLARTAGERIALHIDLPEEGIGLCLADVSQLESALLNLAINARDAIGRAAGSISISLRSKRIEATSEGWPPNGDYVRIAVSDDGPGMPEDVRRRAFEPFFTTKGPGKGTGLGLAQIHGFAHQSGGTAVIESAPGKGTEVAILLPRTDQPMRRNPEPPFAAAETEAGLGETVLLVEDDALVRMALAETLRDLRYHVVEATDADAALALLEGDVPADLILTDLSMPGSMDGLEFASTARVRFPELPVILTTGHAGDLSGRPLPPAMTFVRKPYSRGELRAAVAAALARSRDQHPALAPA